MIHQNLGNNSEAAIYSIFAYFLMALGIVAWKSVIGTYGAAQILMLEALVCLPLFIGLAYYKGGLKLLKTSYPRLQLLRGLLQTGAAYIGLYGLIHLPVSTYTMLQYCTPFIMTVAAVFFLKERCPSIIWLCVAVGFLGTAFILQPEYSENFLASCAVILSCCLWSANVIIMKKMPKDDVITFPFYTVVVVGLVSLVLTIYQGIIFMPLIDFALASVAGAFFFFGAQILFITYRLSALSFLTPFQYTQILWIVMLSYLLWSDIPTIFQIFGLILVMAAAITSAFYKEKSSSIPP